MERLMRARPGYQVMARLKATGIRQREIAKRAGVSQGLVSRIIHRCDEARPDVRERVWLAIEEATQT